MACIFGVAGVLSGCGRGGPDYPCTSLEGTVTLDDEPLADGSVRFLPEGIGQGPAVGGVITDGRYQVDAVPLGTVRVLISSVRKTKPLPSIDGVPRWETENLIPQQYRGGIVIDVTGDRQNQDLDLRSE